MASEAAMRYPEEVYKAEHKSGAAPTAEAELSREEHRQRRAAKKRAAKKHRAQKARPAPPPKKRVLPATFSWPRARPLIGAPPSLPGV